MLTQIYLSATKERFVRLTVKRLGSMNKESSWACPEERQSELQQKEDKIEIIEAGEIETEDLMLTEVKEIESELDEKDIMRLFKNPDYIFIRNSLHRCMSGGDVTVVGYTRNQLRAHIQSRFSEGMSWDNYGEWHIDHIKPIKAFIDEGVTDPAIINSLDNLQPLWASDNISKGAKYEQA